MATTNIDGQVYATVTDATNLAVTTSSAFNTLNLIL